ncbi:MAG TPA: AAA family ATPase [Anaerolineae bacterium]|nr:AAA family ATPase [Anaerolineae bacterium]
MELLERDAPLRELEAAWKQAAAGEGRVALVSGEAGIGKTALVERFTRDHRDTARVLWSACDALFTPRPLGPLHDIAAQIQGDLLARLNSDASRAMIFSTVLVELQRTATIVVIEDIHWADEATLDLIKFLGRRLQRTRALLIATFRDDELGLQHPLRFVLGDLATSTATRRFSLAPLSLEAVRALVGRRAFDPEALHRRTGGNPFFIGEVIASGASGIPPTVRDAVLARAARLSASAGAVLEAAAVIGLRIEPWLLADVTGAEAQAADECLAAGMLLAQGELVAFRHELARQTILDTIAPHRRMVLNQLVLHALRSSPATRSDLARLAHHAQASGDREAVLELAPAAARQAASASAHREAAALYALALRFANDLPPADHAQLLEAYAGECVSIDQREEGLEAQKKALELWRQLGVPLKQGQSLANIAWSLNGLGKTAAALEASRQAIEILEAQPPSRELARAYRMQAGLENLCQNYRAGIEWAQKAIALAELFEDQSTVLSAHIAVGAAWLVLDYEHGRQYLERNLRAARHAGQEHLAALIYTNLSCVSSEVYQFQYAERYLMEGMAHAAEHGLEIFHLYMLAWQALTHLRLGRWNEAAGAAGAVLGRPGVSVTSRITALAALGYLRTRRGDPNAHVVLKEALDLSKEIESLHRIGLVRAARAEAAWQAGDRDQTLQEARAVYDLAVSKQHPWFTGELAFWRWRAGDEVRLPEWTARPFALHIAGDWRAAAEEWKRLGCPYEQARALADGDAAAQIAALEIFERLGALPAADALRQKMRTAGVRAPRKPRASTRENPFGLTHRQVEILRLLTEDLSNAEIAARLHLSPKTIGHRLTISGCCQALP